MTDSHQTDLGTRRICIFCRSFYPSVGGLERIAYILACELSRYASIEVVTDTEADYAGQPFSVKTVHGAWGRLRRFAAADLVIFMNVTLHGVPLALIAGKKVLLTHHGIYFNPNEGFKTRLLDFVKRRIAQRLPSVSVSRYVAQHLPGRSVVIRNAYDNALFDIDAGAARDRYFVFCGRLVSDKGAVLLVDAFRRLLDSHPQASLTVVGDGPERGHIEAAAHGLPRGSIFLTGALCGQELVSTMRRHHCLVVPSIWEEPFGIVALEGLAVCRTVIASKRGGLPEALGGWGMRVMPEVDDLCNGMAAVAECIEAGTILPGEPSDAARRHHLDRHSPKKVASKYWRVIQTISRERP